MAQTLKRGDKVVFLNTEAHKQCPRWYPPKGTVGTVVHPGVGTAWVQWPSGTTDNPGRWFAPLCELAPAPTTPLQTALNRLCGLFRKHK